MKKKVHVLKKLFFNQRIQLKEELDTLNKISNELAERLEFEKLIRSDIEQRKDELEKQNKKYLILIDEESKLYTKWDNQNTNPLNTASDDIISRFKDNFKLIKAVNTFEDNLKRLFYWTKQKEQSKLICVGNVNGYYYYGELLTYIYNYLLTDINKDIHLSVNEILEKLNTKFAKILKENNQENKYCAEISLIEIDDDNRMKYSNLQQPIYIIRNNKLIELKPETGKIGANPNIKIQENEIALSDNDIVYIFTNGFVNQEYGKENNAIKFGEENFKKLILDASQFDFDKQKELIYTKLENLLRTKSDYWKHDQTDNILIIGLRI